MYFNGAIHESSFEVRTPQEALETNLKKIIVFCVGAPGADWSGLQCFNREGNTARPFPSKNWSCTTRVECSVTLPMTLWPPQAVPTGSEVHRDPAEAL